MSNMPDRSCHSPRSALAGGAPREATAAARPFSACPRVAADGDSRAAIGNEHGRTDAWLNRHIFPNGALPATADISRAVHGLFVIEDWHNFRADYDRTVMAWHANFVAHAEARGAAMPARFRRMWSYYLQTMAGSFRAGCRNQLWQIVLSKRGVAGGYRSLR